MATLDLRGEVNLAGTWTDATTLIYQRNPVSVTRGRQNESSGMAPSQATFTVNNRDGRWTVRNPAGAWYGSLVQNTQFRLSVPASVAGLPNYMRLETDTTSYASTPDSAALQITSGTLSVRIDCKITDYSAQFNLLGKWGGATLSWVLNVNSNGTLVLTTNDGTNSWGMTSTLPLPYYMARIAIRADYNIAAQTVTFFTAPAMAGSWTQLGAVIPTGATALSGAAGQAIHVGNVTARPGMLGEVYEVQVYGQTGGTAAYGTEAHASDATGTLTSLACNKPASTVSGDLLVACVQTGNGSSAFTAPAGWTPMIAGTNYSATTGFNDGADSAAQLFTKTAGGAEPASYTFSWTVASRVAISIVRVTGSNGTIRAVRRDSAGGTGTTFTSTALAGTLAGDLVVAVGIDGDDSAVTGATITPPASPWTTINNFAGGYKYQANSWLPGPQSTHTAAFQSSSATARWNVVTYAVEPSAATPALVADPVFTAQAAGTTTFSDAQANTWTLAGTSAISGRLYRFAGELSSLPKASDPSQADLYSDATASGITQRLQQGSNPANSAFYRAVVRQTGTAAPVAYWPCEDVTGSTQIASAVPGGVPMAAAAVTLAGNSSFACSAPIVVLNNAQMTGTVPPAPSVTWTNNVIRFLMQVPSGGDTNLGIICQVFTAGTVRRFVLVYGTGGTLTMIGYSATGAQLFTTGAIAYGVNGALLFVSVELLTAGSNITYEIATLSPGSQSAFPTTGTLTSATVGAVTGVQMNPAGLLNGTAVGHLSVQSVDINIFTFGQPLTFSGQVIGPLNAWSGETAGQRFSRLCGEEGITCRIAAPADLSQPMGNQTQQTILALLQECETTDQGMMFEPRQVPGLGYIPVAGLYQQPAAVTGNYTAAAVSAGFAATSDDQLVVNDVTATAADGSSSRQVLATGPQSVAAVGRIDTSITVNTQNDAALGSEASWYLHVRTVNDDRYGTLPFQMARAATPAAAGALEIGQYLQLTNTPAWVPPGPVKQLCAGYTETFMPQPLWQIGVNAVPETPYEAGIVGDTVYGHADTDGSTLHAGINNSVTSMTVDTATGFALWTTTAGDFPFDIQVNFGEVMTVTNITGASNPQTFTVTRGVNGVAVAHNALDDIRLAHPMIVAL